MQKIVGIKFEDSSHLTYYTFNEEFESRLKKGYNVIVDDEKGIQLGQVATDIHNLDESKLEQDLYEIVRIATKKDYLNHLENIKEAKKAFKKCQELIKKYELDMKLLDSMYTLNKDQLIFRFYADKRIDFRDLAKELASIYHTRIELRQVGVRDKAGEIGGLGVCGQKLCCSRFLKEFDSVSIAMAKNQNLALSPSKINGICGRLLCCLKYEDECYTDFKKDEEEV